MTTGRRLESFLEGVGALRTLSPLVLPELAAALQELQVGAGEIIVRQASGSDGLYLIEAGTVSVEVADRTVARLGPGEYFGELGLLDGAVRTATVRAETPCTVQRLPQERAHHLISIHPELEAALRRTANNRRMSLQHALDGGAAAPLNLAEMLQRQPAVAIGRSPDNDVVVRSRVVSGHHARVRRDRDAFVLEDLGSSNGTYVNGEEITSRVLRDGDQIFLADTHLLFDSRGLSRVVEPAGIRIDASGLRREVAPGVNLLADISLAILPGEFVAIVGGSGAGKSTLMDALSGVQAATGGQVLYNGEDFATRRALYTHQLGYVPQDDIIHRDLPLRSTLAYAARLRLPGDTPAAERHAAVVAALAQLGLSQQADIKVSGLSGGQRKRASIGVELLTQPRVFFLDEPTSGLDPATDASMMQLLRDLADAGSTVVLTTHATANVPLCDKVVFLATGGHLAFVGTPAEALTYFDVGRFDDIYSRLDGAPPPTWSQQFAHSQAGRTAAAQLIDMPAPQPAGAMRAARGQRGLALRIRQLRTLSARNAELYLRNPQRTIPLFMQPIAFSILLIALFRTGVFGPDNTNLGAPTQLIFIFVFTVFLFGLLFGIQEIVAEFSIFRRERLVNLGIVPYVASKLTFLVPVMAFGATVMLVILTVFDRLPSGGLVAVYLPLWTTLMLLGLVGLALALMSSAIARTSQAATDSLSIWIMPQVLFSGAIFPVPEMALPGRIIAIFVPLRWGFEAAGRVVDLNALYAASPSPIAQSLLLQYESSFSRDVWQNWLILGIFIAVPMAVTLVVLARRTRV